MNYEQDKEKPAYIEKMVEVPQKTLAFDPAEVLAEAERIFPVIKGEFEVEDLADVFNQDMQQFGNAEGDLEDLVFRIGRELKACLRLRKHAMTGEVREVVDPRTGKKRRAMFKPAPHDKKGLRMWQEMQIERNKIERAAAADEAEAAGDRFAKMSPEEKKKALRAAEKRLAEIEGA